MLDFRIVKYIKVQARKALKGQDEKFLNGTWHSLNVVFQRWKLEHGNRDVKYKTVVYGLADTRNENKIKSFDEAEPWECAGLETPSRIGLAIILEVEKYPDFIKLLNEVELTTIYALLIQRHTDVRSDRDLFFAYAMMVEQEKRTTNLKDVRRIQQEKKLLKAGEKQLENLSKGRVVAANNKRERSKEYHKEWKKWAEETYKNGPAYWDAEKILDKVCSLAEQHGHKMSSGKPYARKTIQDVITGVKLAVQTQR